MEYHSEGLNLPRWDSFGLPWTHSVKILQKFKSETWHITHHTLRITYWENEWKNRGGIMMNGVPCEVPRPKPEGPQAPRVFGRGTFRGTPFTMTRRYGPLHGPTSSSCGGLRPLAKVFVALPAGKKRAYFAVLPIFGHFWCSLVTLITFSSNLSTFEKNPKSTKKIQKN